MSKVIGTLLSPDTWIVLSLACIALSLVLYTGGSGALRDVAGAATSEASVAEHFSLVQGIAPGRLLLEGQSPNTAENTPFSLALVAPAQCETWILVTSAFHMPRAMRSFEAAGWEGLVACELIIARQGLAMASVGT